MESAHLGRRMWELGREIPYFGGRLWRCTVECILRHGMRWEERVHTLVGDWWMGTA